MENRTVSIIVPVYKVEAYLRPCVESILAQTYRDLQIILVDDGSPDNCGAICDEFARRDSRVLALHKPNGGVCSARNVGLGYVKGQYLTFCDSDDAYESDWIEKLVSALESRKADIVVAGFRFVYEDGTESVKNPHEAGQWVLDTPHKQLAYCFKYLLQEKHGWEIWDRMFRSELVLQNQVQFCETCSNHSEDLGFVLECSLHSERIAAIEECGYLYTVRAGSMMQSSVSIPKLNSVQEVYFFSEPRCKERLPSEYADKALPWLYFQMVGQQFMSKLWSSGMEPEELRKAAIANVADWQRMENHIRWILKEKKYWNPYYPASYNLELARHMQFLLSGSWLKLRIWCKLIRMLRPVIDGAGKHLMADL